MIEKEAQEYINSLPKYGTKEYWDRIYELEERGFFDSLLEDYNGDDEEWEDEEYEQG